MVWPQDPHHDRPPAGYRFVRGIDRIVLGVWFRDFTMLDMDVIPDEGGVLFVAWHPGAMVDPAVMFAALPGQLTFVAKHTLFRMPVLGQVLRLVGVQPVQRPGEEETDAAARSATNAAMLSTIAEALDEGHRAAIFPEGMAHNSPGPSRVRSGASRVMLQATRLAIEHGHPRPSLVPLGLHYTDQHRFRERAVLQAHRPLTLPPLPGEDGAPVPSDEQVAEHGAEAAADRAWIAAVNADLQTEIERVSLGVETWEDRAHMRRTSELWRAFGAGRPLAEADERSLAHTVVANRRVRAAWGWVREHEPERASRMRAQLGELDAEMRHYDLHARDLAQREAPPRRGQLMRWMGSWLLTVVAMLGAVTPLALVGSTPPYLVTRRLTTRWSPDANAVGSYKLYLSVLMYPIWWTLLSGPLAAGLLATAFWVQGDTWEGWHGWGGGPLAITAWWLTWAALTAALWFIWPLMARWHLWLWRRQLRAWRRLRRWWRLRDASVPWVELRSKAVVVADDVMELGRRLILPGDDEWTPPATGDEDWLAVGPRASHEEAAE